jgi:hypothetical protein
MHPEHKRRRSASPDPQGSEPAQPTDQPATIQKQFGHDTDEDTNKALAEAEWKNLWDATEVIDMDTF